MVSDNKKGFFKYVNSKRRSKENNGLILDEDDYLTCRDEEKVETFNAFLPQSLILVIDWRAARSSELEDRDCGSSDFPLVDTEIVRASCIC